MNEWYYSNGGQQAGPVTIHQLEQWARSGQFRPDISVWCEGMPYWRPAGEVPALAGLFGMTPISTGVAAGMNPAGPALSYESPGQGVVHVTPRALSLLQQTKPWVRLFSVLLFIGVGGMVIVALMQFAGAASLGSSRSGYGQAAGGLAAVSAFLMLAMSALYLVPAIFLGRYASRIRDLMQYRRPSDLEKALEAQKSYWKFLGICVIIVFSLYILAAIIGVAAFSRM